MIDIIKFKGQTLNLGFDNILHLSQFKVIEGSFSLEENRKLIDKKMDIFLCPEKNIKGHNIKTLDTGLNHVICKLATEREIAIGFSFSSLLNADNLSLTLARMKTNIKLCKKYKTKIIIASFAQDLFELRSPNDLIAFGNVIGLNTKEAKNALNFKK
jgi:RNase P/RNase MRP subunit p30